MVAVVVLKQTNQIENLRMAQSALPASSKSLEGQRSQIDLKRRTLNALFKPKLLSVAARLKESAHTQSEGT